MSLNDTLILTQADQSNNNDLNEMPVAGIGKTMPEIHADILPRPKRKKRRAKTDLGLPSDEELGRLARFYLEQQKKHWPEVAQAGLLPEPDGDVVHEMVEDFKHRHRGGSIDLKSVQVFRKFCHELGGNYNRFSCDNSDPLSIVDQLSNVLRRARERNQFIPWSYVFCDYGVSGRTANRQGYSSYKAIIQDPNHLIKDTYIDDFTRAGRDMEEWLRFARISKRMRIGIIGVSDGFDLNSHDGELKIGMLGVLSNMQTQGLCEKVGRGMRGTAERGTCLGKLPLGFTRQICRDGNGNIVYRPNGCPRHKPCIDPETSPYRLKIFELYINENLSRGKIAKYFNKLQVDGSNGWTSSSIGKLLTGQDAIGIFIWNRKRREYDYDQEKYIVIEKPESEWITYENPDLAIVPKELWDAAQEKIRKRREDHPMTGKKWSRNQNSATTLFSGTLFCKYCGSELRLYRSAHKYKVMCCLSGATGTHDCPLSLSKSTRIIEDCLLDYISDSLLTEEMIECLVQKANIFLEQEARKPQVDTMPMKAEVREKQLAIKKLVKRVEKEPDESLCFGYHSRIKELQQDVNELNATIRKADAHNKGPLKPLDIQQAKAYLADMRMLLKQEIPMAAEAIRRLTGPIMIRQEEIPGKRGGRWIATFTPNLLALCHTVAAKNGSPSAEAFKIAPANTESVEVVIEQRHKYEKLATKFKRLRDEGASIQSIAAAHQMSWTSVQQVLEFADSGKRPDWGPSRKRKRSEKTSSSNDQSQDSEPAQVPKYQQIAPEVKRLRDDERMSFAKIAIQLEVNESTIRRAYDYLHPEKVQEAIKNKTSTDRGSYSHLGESTLQKIRELLRDGMKVKDVAQEVGCGVSTVRRMLYKMRDEAA